MDGSKLMYVSQPERPHGLSYEYISGASCTSWRLQLEVSLLVYQGRQERLHGCDIITITIIITNPFRDEHKRNYEAST